MARRIILDCDPGHDDAIAILLAAGSPQIEIAAITTVSGNQSVEKVTRNALAIAELAGLTDVPVARGSDRPLVRAAEYAPGIHGDSGLDGPALPVPTRQVDGRHAARLIIDEVMGSVPGELTLIPTGPLTNIALAVRLEPRIVPRVREVVFMGGAVRGGNWSATSEFNIVADPEAAAIVLRESWPVTMVGLDVTHRALAGPDIRERIAATGTEAARVVGELLDFFGTTYLEAQGFAAPPVHDPVAVAAVIDPAVLDVRRAALDVELRGTLTAGMTVADLRGPAPEGTTTSVALGIDVDRFWDLVVNALGRLP